MHEQIESFNKEIENILKLPNNTESQRIQSLS